VNYITFVDLFASLCASKKRILFLWKGDCAGWFCLRHMRGMAPQRAGNAHLEGGETVNSIFIRGALFSAETENIVRSLIIYKSTNTIPQSK